MDSDGGAAITAGDLVDAPTSVDDQAVADLGKSALTNTRKAAEDWRTGLLLLAGLVTTFTAVKGAESVSKLADPAPIALAVLCAIALSAAVIGSLFSLAASFGVPGATLAVRRGVAQEIADWEQDESQRSAFRIKVSAVAAVVSVLFLALAIGVTWFGGIEPAAFLKVGFGEAAPWCGTVKSSDSSNITVTNATNGDKTIPMSSVTSIEVVAAC